MHSRYVFKNKLKRLCVSLFDGAGRLIYPLLSIKNPAFDAASVERILIIRLDHIGDVVMTRPAIQAVVRAFPSAKVDLLISSELIPLFEQEPGIHQIIPAAQHWFSRDAHGFDQYRGFRAMCETLKCEKYDLGIDFRGDLRHIVLMQCAHIPTRLGFPITGGGFMLTHQGDYSAKLHQVDLSAALLKKLGISASLESHPFSYPSSRKELLTERFPFLLAGEKKRVVVHIGSGYLSKRWPADRYRWIISKLIQNKNTEVVLIGTKAEKSEILMPVYSGRVFDLRGLLAIEELPALFDLCHFYIGNDSGPAHIAAAQNMSGLILFSGANDSSVWRPWSDQIKILTHPVSCSPCGAEECPLKHHECMDLITAAEVLNHIPAAFKNDFSRGLP